MNIRNKLKNEILQFVRETRQERGAKFMFLPKSLGLKDLLNICAAEIFKKKLIADKILINVTLQDLIGKKILHPVCTRYYNYSMGGITYHDVYLKTIDGKFYCRGTSTDKSEAFAKAIGEVFERTAIKFGNSEEIINRKISEIKNNPSFFDFNLRAMPTEKQMEFFTNSKIADEDSFDFVEVEKISDGSKIFIPRQAVFFGFSGKEKVLLQSSTNGAGASFTDAGAFVSGFYEIIHRHYFFKSWYSGKSPNLLNLKTLPENSTLLKKISEFQKRGFVVNFLDFSEEAEIPTYICILEKLGGWYCGGSTGDLSLLALERSLDEAFSTYFWSIQADLSGINNVSEELVLSLKDDFVDTRMDPEGMSRVFLFGNSFFVSKFDNFILKGKLTNYSTKFDKNKNFSNSIRELYQFARQKFGDNIFLHKQNKKYLEEYNYFVSKVYIPNSYYFALSETMSRPVIDNISPVFTKINPFP